MSEQYNGWTNYETWAFITSICNEQDSYRMWVMEATDALQYAGENPVGYVEDALNDYLSQEIESIQSRHLADVFAAGVEQINVREVAAALVDSANEEMRTPIEDNKLWVE